MQKTEAAKTDLADSGAQRFAPSDRMPKEKDIAVVAYRLWEERGCPEGSPDDWYRSEQELAARSESSQSWQ